MNLPLPQLGRLQGLAACERFVPIKLANIQNVHLHSHNLENKVKKLFFRRFPSADFSMDDQKPFPNVE